MVVETGRGAFIYKKRFVMTNDFLGLDYTLFYCTSDENVQLLKFCKHAGYKVNLSNTQCILLGCFKINTPQLDGKSVTDDAVRSLVIYIGHNKTQCYELNWSKTSDDMQKLFDSWKKRKLTIYGKASVVYSLSISHLIYKASTLSFNDLEYIQQI